MWTQVMWTAESTSLLSRNSYRPAITSLLAVTCRSFLRNEPTVAKQSNYTNLSSWRNHFA